MFENYSRKIYVVNNELKLDCDSKNIPTQVFNKSNITRNCNHSHL